MTRGTSNLPSGLPKDWKQLAEAMKDLDWTFEEGSKHPKSFAPDGVTWATLSKTPGDHRSLKNATAAIRRWCRGQGITPTI
jgi:hypothetical protein